MQMLSFAEQQNGRNCEGHKYESKAVILDEPTAALAQQERINLYQVVNTLKERGVGTIYITHIFEEVFSLRQTRVSVLRDGQYIVRRTGKPR